MASSKTASGVTLYPAGQNGFAASSPASASSVVAKKHQPADAKQIAMSMAKAPSGHESDHSSEGAASDYESEPEPSRIGAQTTESRGGIDSETVRRALDLPHIEKNAISVQVEIEHDASLDDLVSGKVAIGLHKKINQKFMKAVTDASGNELLIGDPSRSQITHIYLLEYQNEFPVSIGLDHDLKGSAPKMTSGNNALSFSAILKKETMKSFTKKGGCGLLLHENLDALPEQLFQQWGNVRIEDLTVGITPISGTDESTLDIDVNKRIPDILHTNQARLERDFPQFKYKHLVKDVKLGRRKIRIWNSVLQKAIDIGIHMAVKPIAERTQDPSSLQLKMRSTTSESGNFSDLLSVVTRRKGQDLAADAMSQVYTLSLTLKIVALVAGTNTTSTAAAAAPRSGSPSAQASPDVSDTDA